MAVSVVKHKVRVAVAVKVGYDSPGHARYQRMRVSVRRVTWQRRVVKVIQALHETWAHTRVNALSKIDVRPVRRVNVVTRVAAFPGLVEPSRSRVSSAKEVACSRPWLVNRL